MVDEADEHWVAEHGFLADNPLLNEILHASDLLRTTHRSGSSFGVAPPRSGASFCARGGISTTGSTAIGSSWRSLPSGSLAVAALLHSSDLRVAQLI
jgi:hypothetical protein